MRNIKRTSNLVAIMCALSAIISMLLACEHVDAQKYPKDAAYSIVYDTDQNANVRIVPGEGTEITEVKFPIDIKTKKQIVDIQSITVIRIRGSHYDLVRLPNGVTFKIDLPHR